MAILSFVGPVSLALGLTMGFHVQLATSSTFEVAARAPTPPGNTIAPLPNTLVRRAGKITCDGDHGVFTCLSGSCNYDDTGAFACCNDTLDCTAIQTCIPYDKGAGGKTCSIGNGACMSCTDNKLPNCYTIINKGMSHSALFCANTGGSQVYSFTFHMNHMTEPAPSPSTFIGAPIPTSSAPATLVGPPVQPSSTSSTSLSDSPMDLASSRPLMTVSTVVTIETIVPAASKSPNLSDKLRHQLPGSTIGGIAIGSIAGACFLWVGLFFLYVRCKNRKMNRQSGMAGILAGPRRSVDDDTDGNDHGARGTADTIDVPAGVNELPGNGSTPRQSRQHADWSLVPRLPPRDVSLSSPPSPVFPFSQATTIKANTIATPNITVSDTESSPVDNCSPPFTNTNTPVSPVSPSISPTFNHRPISAATAVFPETVEEKMRKSSRMLPIAGPYLTAERALGDGFWEAEREQAEADRAIADKGEWKREYGTRGMSVDNHEDDPGMESETSTGTVVRRGVRK